MDQWELIAIDWVSNRWNTFCLVCSWEPKGSPNRSCRIFVCGGLYWIVALIALLALDCLERFVTDVALSNASLS